MLKLNFFIKGSLSKVSSFYFSRKIKDTGTLKERQISHHDSKLVDTIEEHKFSERMDPQSKEIDDIFLANCRLSVQHLPERLLKRIHQIFSKYKVKDLRHYGKEYLKLYRALNASEKPLLDYNKAQPFVNTEKIIESNPKLIYLRSPKISEEEKEEKVVLKRKEKEKKKEEANQPIADLVEEGKKKEDPFPNLIYSQNIALGYLIKKMPNTFVVACRILTEIKYRLPDFKPKNFLDYGAGMGMGLK